MRKRKRGRGTMRPPPLSLLALAATVRWGTSRPVSIVHQEHEPPPPLRKAPTDRSPFAREAASAARVAAKSAATSAAARAELDNNPTADDASRHAKHPALASSFAEVDASLGVIVPEEKRYWDARAVVLPGERTSLIVAGTVDGQVHALDPATGDLKWSFSTGDPLIKSYQQLPGPLDDKKWWIPTLDGSMLVHTSHGLQRPGLNARVLVEQTPFLSGRTFYTGSKVSRIFGVDAHTGELRQVLSGDTADGLESNRRLLARSGSDDDVIWIGRDDYTARAFDVSTGQEEWNLTIGQFVSLDGLYLEASSAAADSTSTSSSSSSGNGGARTAAAAAAAQLEQTPSLIATPDGSLRLKAPTGVKADKANPGSNRNSEDDWNVPLPAHVASVFQVALEEGSDHTYIPMRQMPLSQSAGIGESMVSSGTGGAAAVGVLENGQVYAVALDEHDSDGEDSGDGGSGGNNRSSGGGASAAGGHRDRGKMGRAGEGKVTHGGRPTATQPLLPHGDWQRDSSGGGGFDYEGGSDGGGHGLSNALIPSMPSKGSSQSAASGPPKRCQPGYSDFPNCLSGTHTVRQSRSSLVEDWNAGSSLESGAGAGQGVRDPGGVRASTFRSRLPSPSNADQALPGGGSGVGGGSLAEMMGRQGMGTGGRNYLPQTRSPQGAMHSLLSWLYHGWSLVSLGILAVMVMVFIDSRRATKFLKQVGLGRYPLYAAGGAGAGEYDPTADGGFSGVSDSSASTGGGGGAAVAAAAATAVVTAGGVKGELRVGCLTVSDTVLGYGSHGTVVYRGLLEGRPVAVKRMLTDFHARADREISLLIESDGHPNVVRYFVREEAGEFVYLALQLCQLSLHNAMAQIHGAMARTRRKLELDNGEKSGALRVGLGRALTTEDVSAPAELRAALLQVSQGVEHLHSLRIVHRDLKPHNILLAANDRKGPGLGRKSGSTVPNAAGHGEGEEEGGLEVPRKLSGMRDVSNFVLKISDMGLGKQLLNGQSSFGMSSYGRTPGRRDQGQGGDALARARASNAQASSSAGGHVGSIGWQAPEVIADRVSLEGGQGPSAAAGAEGSFSSSGSSSSWAMAGGSSSSSSRRTQAVDVFSLGCIFHHCIVPGSHPFGQWYEREANIIQDKASHLAELAHVPDAYDLVSLMTAREPDLRPSAGEVCKHPFFWNEEKRLSFLLEFSDRLEQDSFQSPLLVMVESGADQVVGRSWDVRLDPELTEDAGRYRKYDFSSVRDLLRVVRNKRHHFHELPERVQGLMSPLPSGFLRYVEDRFPQLLMHCTKVTGALLSEERLFREYLVPFSRRPPPSSTSASAAPATQPAVPVAATPGASAAASAPETDGSSGERSAPPSPMPSVGSKSAAVPGPTTPPPPQALLSPTPRAAGTPGSSLGDGVWAGGSAGEGAVGAAGTLSPAVTANGSAGGRGSARGREAFSSGGQGSSISPVRRSAGTTPRSGRKTYEGGDGGADGAVGSAAASAGGGLPVRVTEQSGARGENALQDVLVWNESGMAKSMGCRGWWRHQDHWNRRLDVTKQRPRGAHLNKALLDSKYRTRLCSHWENSKGMLCPMRRRGAGKCDFAHGGLELRVRANKRDRWGRSVGPDGGVSLHASGGEDTLGAARSIGRIRIENGEKDGAGCATIAGGRGGGGGGGGGAGIGGAGGGGGARQGKRGKGGGAAAQGGDGAGGGGNQGRARGGNGSGGESKSASATGEGAREGGAAGEGRPPRERGAPPDSGEPNGDVAQKLRPAAATVGAAAVAGVAVVTAANGVGRRIENGTVVQSRVGVEARGRLADAGGGSGQAASEGAAASDRP